jgi:uncharacterized protein involved in exopolysaccharide biosynthesis
MVTADRDHAGYGLYDLLHTLFRRRRLALLFALGVLATVAIRVLTMAPMYESTASILVKSGFARVPLAPTESPVVVSKYLSEEDINSEIGILTSRLLLENATRAVQEQIASEPDHDQQQWFLAGGEDTIDESLNPTKPSTFDLQVTKFESALTVEQASKSDIIALRLVWPYPKEAQLLLSALIKNYQELRNRLYEPPGAATFFQKHAKEATAELKAAESALQQYLLEGGLTLIGESQGISGLEAEERSALERSEIIERNLGEARTEALGIHSKLRKIRTQIMEESARVRADLLNRERDALQEEEKEVKTEISELEERVSRLHQKKTQAIETLGKIRVLEDQLRALLLQSQRSVNSKQLQKKVDRIYGELAALGQLKRYDLRVGQDLQQYEYLDKLIVEAELDLSVARRRAGLVEAELSELEARENAAQMSGTSEDVGAVWTVINTTREQLARVGAMLGIDDPKVLAQVFEDLVASLVDGESELEGLRARITELELQAAAAKRSMATLNEHAVRTKELQRDLARAEEAYTLYSNKAQTTAISAAMAQEQLANISVVQPPTISWEPVGIGRRVVVLLGLFLAAVGGTGFAMLIDYLDRRIATPRELERQLGLACLASTRVGETDGPLELGLAARFPETYGETQRDLA